MTVLNYAPTIYREETIITTVTIKLLSKSIVYYHQTIYHPLEQFLAISWFINHQMPDEDALIRLLVLVMNTQQQICSMKHHNIEDSLTLGEMY